VNPHFIEAKEGNTIEFRCISKKEPLWYKESGIFIPSPKPKPFRKGGILIIEKVKGTDRGFYQCHGNNNQDDEFHARVELIVEGKFCSVLCLALITCHKN